MEAGRDKHLHGGQRSRRFGVEPPPRRSGGCGMGKGRINAKACVGGTFYGGGRVRYTFLSSSAPHRPSSVLFAKPTCKPKPKPKIKRASIPSSSTRPQHQSPKIHPETSELRLRTAFSGPAVLLAAAVPDSVGHPRGPRGGAGVAQLGSHRNEGPPGAGPRLSPNGEE